MPGLPAMASLGRALVCRAAFPEVCGLGRRLQIDIQSQLEPNAEFQGREPPARLAVGLEISLTAPKSVFGHFFRDEKVKFRFPALASAFLNGVRFLSSDPAPILWRWRGPHLG
ncbi:MAG: hypothetical protein HRU32_10470 [Rhodobacteraceae bacterium]|nr:hypothetical protein [Paracoccaceae bacterium]